MSELLGTVRRHRVSLWALAMVLLVAWLLWAARGALPAFFIGLALAFVLDPIVTRLQRFGVPRWLGVLLSYAGVVALVWLLVAFAIPPIAAQTRDFANELPRLGAAITEWEQGLVRWYQGLQLPPEVRSAIDASIEQSQAAFADMLRALAGPLVSTVVRTATFVLGLVVIPVWLFFALKDRERFPRALAGALPPSWRADADNVLRLLGRVGGRWVRGQLILGLVVGTATAIGLTILTFVGFSEMGQFTLVLAVIAGVLEWFPIIGPIVSAIPAILIAVTISPAAVVAVVILYVAVQQLENNLLVPKVMGDAVELHPAVMVIALVVGGGLFGIGGAILAAPTVAAGRDLYRYGFLRLSGEAPLRARELVVQRDLRPPPEVPGPEPEAPDADAPHEAREAPRGEEDVTRSA